MYENGVLRRISEPKRDVMPEAGENCMMRSCIVFNLHQILDIRVIK
jgi:hypothetical protein